MIEVTMTEKDEIALWQFRPIDRILEIRVDVNVDPRNVEPNCAVTQVGKTQKMPPLRLSEPS